MRYPPSHLVCLVHPLLNEDTDPDRLVILRSFPKSLDKSKERLCEILENAMSRKPLAEILLQFRRFWAPSVTKQPPNLQAQFPSLFISDFAFYNLHLSSEAQARYSFLFSIWKLAFLASWVQDFNIISDLIWYFWQLLQQHILNGHFACVQLRFKSSWNCV